MAVVAAFKLDDVLAIRISTGQSYGRHGCFRAGTDEADLFDRRECLNHGFREFGFNRSACAKAGAVTVDLLHRLDHAGKSMAKDERAPGADVVDVLIAIGVPYARALAAHEIRRLSPYGFECPHPRIHTARGHPGGASVKQFGVFQSIHTSPI